MKKWITIMAVLFFSAGCLSAQDPGPRIQAFQGSRMVNAASGKMLDARVLSFTIAHRFGNMGGGGTGHTLWGLDVSKDIRFGFEYGLTDRINLVAGRSKFNENIDLGLRYAPLFQQENKSAIGLTLFPSATISMAKKTDVSMVNWEHRITYSFQAVITRKFGEKLGLALTPVFIHQNYTDREKEGKGFLQANDIIGLGTGVSFKLNRTFTLTGDYFLTLPRYFYKNQAIEYFPPIGLGVEINTGGHIFSINFSNAPAILESGFLPESPDSWLNGGFKAGFSITRNFYL